MLAIRSRAMRGECLTMYGKFAYVYDRLMDEMPYPEWLSFMEACWERYGKPSSIVDVGCGTGKLSLSLAAQGFMVTGIDLSADMLAVAGQKAAEGQLTNQVSFKQQDMREWTLPEQVDCVFSFCDCLNYLLEPEDIRQTFKRCYEGLRSGGLFLFDVHAPAQLIAYAEEQPYMWNEPEVAYIWTCDYDPDRTQVTHDLTFFVQEEEGAERYQRFTEQHQQRGYAPDFLSDELRAAGFHVLDRCADFSWAPPDEDSERIFFVARKLA